MKRYSSTVGSEGVEPVRQRLVMRESKRRRLDERVLLRFPRLGQSLLRTVLRLPPRSAIRRAMVRFTMQRIFEAGNREDWEAALALAPQDHLTITPPELVGLGFPAEYRGREARLRFQQDWMRELGEFRQEMQEVVDLGDRILALGTMKATGLGSGAHFESEVAYLLTFADRRLIREESWRSHAEALEAAGLAA